MLRTTLVFLIVGVIASLNADEKAHSESTAAVNPNHAKVHFMDYKREEFVKFVPGIKEALAKSLNDYCSKKECNLKTGSNITADHIGFIGSTEKDKFHIDGRFIITKVYALNIGQPGEEADHKLDEQSPFPADLMQDFIKEQRANIVEDGKVQIAYVNDELVFPPRNNLDNYIIVTLSCILCVILVIVNIICTLRSNKREKKQFLKEKGKETKPLLDNKYESKSTTNTSINDQKNIQPVSQANFSQQYPQFTSNNNNNNYLRDQSQRIVDDSNQRYEEQEKRRKKPYTAAGSHIIAGNVGSGIGSPRNLAENYDESARASRIRNSHSTEHVDNRQSQMLRMNHQGNNSNYDIYRNSGDVQIPIERLDRVDYNNNNYNRPNPFRSVNDYADSRVAYRLASNERLN